MGNPFVDRRRFFRHPSDVPVECRVKGHKDFLAHETQDISYGGIAFVSDCAYELGTLIELRYPSLSYPESVSGQVVWTAPLSDGECQRYVNGLSFLDEMDHYHGRIVEQICHIEAYRREQRVAYGRELTSQEAASEWIAAHGAEFPH